MKRWRRRSRPQWCGLLAGPQKNWRSMQCRLAVLLAAMRPNCPARAFLPSFLGRAALTRLTPTLNLWKSIRYAWPEISITPFSRSLADDPHQPTAISGNHGIRDGDDGDRASVRSGQEIPD